MDEHVRMTLVVAIVALCAIVGVYYAWVRKLAKGKEESANPPQASVPQR